MKLKPDDIMQEGDVMDAGDGIKLPIPSAWVGNPLRNCPTWIGFITRPTGGRPTKKEAELRQTCVKQAARIEELEKAQNEARIIINNEALILSLYGDQPPAAMLEWLAKYPEAAK